MGAAGANTKYWLLPGLLLLASCAAKQAGAMPTQAVRCNDPRPQMCTMDYRPRCATRDNGVRCITAPCVSIETATYANACSACADAKVFYHVPGACDE